MLECEYVVAITHAFCWPRYVDVAASSLATRDVTETGAVLSKPGSCAAVEHVAFLAGRIKLAVHVDVNGNIQNVGIIIESALTSIS